jgi:hypothetical protein
LRLAGRGGEQARSHLRGRSTFELLVELIVAVPPPPK